jgi:DNA-directed RNA polymerase specialized sigma24 family protein
MDTEHHILHKDDFDEANRMMEGIRINNHSIIEEIYSKYSKDIEKMVTNNHGTSEDARDVFQDVMISIYRQAHNGLQQRCSFYSVLYLACKKRWLTQLSSKYNSKTS